MAEEGQTEDEEEELLEDREMVVDGELEADGEARGRQEIDDQRMGGMEDGGLENGKAEDKVVADGRLKDGVSGGEAELNFVNSRKDGKKSSKRRCFWKQG